MGNLSATWQVQKSRVIKTRIQRWRASVFIAEKRCPVSDVTGRLAEKRWLQYFLTPLAKAGGGRVLRRPRFGIVEPLVLGGMHLHQALIDAAPAYVTLLPPRFQNLVNLVRDFLAGGGAVHPACQ
jgi:hypothetical protein